MKKITLLIAISISTICFGQTVNDFETGSEAPIGAIGGFTATVVTNPDKTGINTSDNCLQIQRTSGDNWWALVGINVTPDLAVSTSDTKYIHFQVYSSVLTDLALRTDGANDASNGTNANIIRPDPYTSVTNAWEEVVIPLLDTPTSSNFSKGTLYRIDFHTDMGFVSGRPRSASSTVYIDNITINDSPDNIYTTTWNGTSSDFSDASNWSSGSPNTSSSIIIPSGTANAPLINSTTGISVDELNINSGASITIQGGGSLIVSSSIGTGTINYTRTLTANVDADKAWHLVASPVTGQTVADFMTNNSLATGTTNSDFRGIASYTNNGSGWSYYSVGYAGSDSFDNGKGYAVKRASAGDITFTGTYTAGSKQISISQGTTNFNLVANPYSAYVNLGTFFTDNAATDRLSEATIWVWNPDKNGSGSGGYTELMSGTDGTFEIAPGQAFFVSSGSASSNVVDFSSSNQSHQTDSFSKSVNDRAEITVYISQNGLKNSTRLFYLDKVTTGFDNGFDGSFFNGFSQDLAIYSDLVETTSPKKLGTQSLPLDTMETTIVPLGIKAEKNKEITFSANSSNIQEGLQVFLEDRLTNKFIDITKETYKITLNENTNDSGRFYLHTSSKSLSTSSIEFFDTTIFTVDKSLKIKGLNGAKGTVSIYNLLGKEVFYNSFKTSNNLDFLIPNITTGVFIVKLSTDKGNLNKKVVVK